MNAGKRLRRELDATLNGDPWYGAAVTRILDGVSADEAAAHPVAGAHSIWELVVHMTAWVTETDRRLRGGAHAPPADGDWPAVTSTGAGAWQSALDALGAAHAVLARTLDGLEEAALDRQIAGGQVDASGDPVTRYQTAVGLVQHDAYHAGQIALLKRALGIA